MARIRIAQKGWNGIQAATTAEEVQVGVAVPWVEIDGYRVEDITGVGFEVAADGFGYPALRVDLIGCVEIVYLDAAGQVLTSSWMAAMGPADRLDSETVVMREDLLDARLAVVATVRAVLRTEAPLGDRRDVPERIAAALEANGLLRTGDNWRTEIGGP